MLSVYNYMSSAVLLSGLVAFFFAMGGENSPAAHILLGGGILKYVIMFAPLGFVIALNMGLSRMSDGTLQAVFWGFAVALIVLLKPQGLWPWLCKTLRFIKPPEQRS